MALRVLVCGGRNYAERRRIWSTLSTLHAESPVALLIEGGASGADRLARSWAEHHRVPVAEFPANWRFEGRRAGPLRNAAMLEHGKPDCVIAFPGGSGTLGMIDAAKRASVPVHLAGEWADPDLSAEAEGVGDAAQVSQLIREEHERLSALTSKEQNNG